MPLKGVFCEDPSLMAPTPIDWEQCLACAATWGNPCSMTYPVLRSIKDDADRGHHFPSVSGLTGCLRKAWLEQTTDFYEYPSSRMALLIGTYVHHLLETATFDSSVPEIPLQYTTKDGITVYGTADLYVPKIKLLQDWKTAKDIYINRVPYGKHEIQVNLYAFMLEHNELEVKGEVEQLQVVYISKVGPDTKKGTHNGIVKVPVSKWPEDRIRAFIEKRAWVLDQSMRGELVPNMVDKADRWACDYCGVRRECDRMGP
jgi:hypothetical protein